MSQTTKGKKPYKHSTTFYRKVKNRLNTTKDVASTTVTNLLTENIIHDVCITQDSLVPHDINNLSEVMSEAEQDNANNSTDSSSEFEDHLSLQVELRKWAVSCNICHASINSLLIILNKQPNINLPKDSRSLLYTPKIVTTALMGQGEFWYNGIKNILDRVYYDIKETKSIGLIFNIDGIPPFKSSGIELWPILLKILDRADLKPQTVAVYCGRGKPPLEDYLALFIEELKELMENGIFVNKNKINVDVKFFVCDTPARSFIKGTVGFNATHGCIKCTVLGEYDKKGHHMSFPRIDCPPRTNESFRNVSDADHHKQSTPLVKLPIDLVKDIIVADSLHLIDLGVMRKCIYGWTTGSYNFKTKLSAREIVLISDMLQDCNKRKPAEIHRAIRSLDYIKNWKGIEYRTFLLYLGPTVLKDFISTKAYDHFLTLFCAVTIVSCDTYLKYINVAEQLFKDYIEDFIDIYGYDSISMNIHNLCHVVDDVKRFGNLTEISAYPFENYLGYLKSLIRGGNRPLAQIAKRLGELSWLNTDTENKSNKIRYINRNKMVLADGFMLSNDTKNKWFLTKTDDIVSFLSVEQIEEQLYITGALIKKKKDFFDLPIKSSRLNIYMADEKFEAPMKYQIKDIKCKLFCTKYRTSLVFFPLLHTLDMNIN